MPGGAASGRKGSRYERELVNTLRAAGWGALRLPSSGSSTERELPDIMAARPTAVRTADGDLAVVPDLWAIEAKAGDATTLYVTDDEVADLEAYAERWGARPLLGGRFTTAKTGTEHFLVMPGDARRTDGGNYGIPAATALDRAYAVVETTEPAVLTRDD